MQTKTKTFKSRFSPSIFVWVWGIELSSSSFCSNHFDLLIHLTGPIIHFLKTTRNIQRRVTLVTWEFACNHPTLDYQRAVWDGCWQPWLVFGSRGIFRVSQVDTPWGHADRFPRQGWRTRSLKPVEKRSELADVRQTLRLRGCRLFPRQERWAWKIKPTAKCQQAEGAPYLSPFLGQPPPSLWNWEAKGSSEESSSFRKLHL